MISAAALRAGKVKAVVVLNAKRENKREKTKRRENKRPTFEFFMYNLHGISVYER
jgi:hypothetical protein